MLRVLRGPRDPKVPELVNLMASALQGPEQQARQWLLNQATANPVWNFLQGLQLMLKKERNIDSEIDVTTKMLPNDQVEVQATIQAPTSFSGRSTSLRRNTHPRTN